MTDATNTTNNTNEAASDEALLKAVAELRDNFENKDRVILFPGEGDANAFLAFTETFDESNPLKDWSAKAKIDKEKAVVYAIAATESGDNRLIVIASKEEALANDAVRDWLYNKYVMHTVNRAKAIDATPDMFETVDGAIGRHTMDFEAFKFQAMAIVKKLRGMGLKNLNVPGLRNALASKAFAIGMYSAKFDAALVAPEGVMAVMRQNAEDRGMNTSIFDYWTATRDNAGAAPKDFEINLAGLEDALEDDGE